MPFDPETALAQAEEYGRQRRELYRALGIPFVDIARLNGVVVVYCGHEGDVPSLCKKVLDEYAPQDGELVN